MNIAIVTAYKNYLGGMEVFTQRLQRVLREHGHAFETFGLEDVSHSPEIKWAQRLPFLPQREEWKARALAGIINPRAHEFDAVIANDYFGMHVKHARTIMVTHGYYPDIYDSMPRGFSFVKKIWWNQLGKIQKKAMEKSWKSVTVSPRNARVLGEYGCRVDETISHGIDTEVFRPLSSPEKKVGVDLPISPPFLLFVGSNAPWKNPGLVERLSSEHPVAWLGKYFGTARGVHSLPRIPDGGMPALYSMASALVHPAFHEGFGYAPIEAMACGTPPLFTRAGVGEEITRALPKLILEDPTSLLEAREKLAGILENRGKWGKACRKYVEENHAWKPWSARWNAFLGEAV